MSDDLSFPDVVPILRRLEGVPLVVIGGQAVNFWATRYLSRAPELAEFTPFTSKDVDFCGTRTSVEEGARRLGGQAVLPEPFDPTPNAGVIVYLDDGDKERTVDVLHSPLGLTWDEVWGHSLTVVITDDDGPASFTVLHPYWTMIARVCNVRQLGPSPSALRQLTASVICLREFLRETLDEGERVAAQNTCAPEFVRAVLKLHRRIFGFAMRHHHGRRIWMDSRVEPFDAAITDPRLPTEHNTRNYPRMAKAVQQLRERQQTHRLRYATSGKTSGKPEA